MYGIRSWRFGRVLALENCSSRWGKSANSKTGKDAACRRLLLYPKFFLGELGIEWIAAHSPQAKGRIERLFETLQDRLVKEMRLAGIDNIAAANRFLEMRFLPVWEKRFTVTPRKLRNAHRQLDREHCRLERILSVRVARKVADDHTVSWDGTRWGVPREESVQVFAVRRWKSNGVWTVRTGCASEEGTFACAIARTLSRVR